MYVSFLVSCTLFLALHSGMTLTKTGRIIRPPEKFQCMDTMDPRKLFKKPVPTKNIELQENPDLTTRRTVNKYVHKLFDKFRHSIKYN